MISAIMPSTVTRIRPVSVDVQNSGSRTRSPATPEQMARVVGSLLERGYFADAAKVAGIPEERAGRLASDLRSKDAKLQESARKEILNQLEAKRNSTRNGPGGRAGTVLILGGAALDLLK